MLLRSLGQGNSALSNTPRGHPSVQPRQLGRPPHGEHFQVGRVQTRNGPTWDMVRPRQIPIPPINHSDSAPMQHRCSACTQRHIAASCSTPHRHIPIHPRRRESSSIRPAAGELCSIGPSQGLTPFLRPLFPLLFGSRSEGNWGEDAFHYNRNINVCGGQSTNPPRSTDYPGQLYERPKRLPIPHGTLQVPPNPHPPSR